MTRLEELSATVKRRPNKKWVPEEGKHKLLRIRFKLSLEEQAQLWSVESMVAPVKGLRVTLKMYLPVT